MERKEPKFMQELHRIRAKLSRKWQKMSDKEFLSHMHKVNRDFKESSHSDKTVSVSR